MISDKEIPDAPLLIEIQIIQGKNMVSKKDPYVTIKVGGDEVYRTSTAKKALNPTWQGDPFVSKYEAETDGPIYLEVATGRGSWQTILGRSLIPLRGEEERKTSNEQQSTIWLKMAGTGSSEPSELQISVLSEPIIREANVTLVREKKPVKLILIADMLYVFSDIDKCRKLKRRIPLGVNAKMEWENNSCEIHIEPPESGDNSDGPFVFKTDNDSEAAAWNSALRPFVGPVTTPIFGVSLDDAMNSDRILNPRNTSGIPSFVDIGLNYIEKNGLKEQGVFRIGYSSIALDDAIRRIETGQRFIEEFDSVHMVTSVLKRYFRSLPECLMTNALLDEAMKLFDECDDGNPNVEDMSQIIAKLPLVNATILGRVFRLCSLICKNQDTNMMSDKNLSIVIGPTVFCVDTDCTDASFVMILPKVNALTMFMITHTDELFPCDDSQMYDTLDEVEEEEESCLHPPPQQQSKEQVNETEFLSSPRGLESCDNKYVPSNDEQSCEDSSQGSLPSSVTKLKPLPPPPYLLPSKNGETEKNKLFAPIDPDDLEGALKQALAIYEMYGNGGGAKGWMMGEGLCDLLLDLKYVYDIEQAEAELEEMFVQLPMPRNKFVTWWMDNHNIFVPY